MDPEYKREFQLKKQKEKEEEEEKEYQDFVKKKNRQKEREDAILLLQRHPIKAFFLRLLIVGLPLFILAIWIGFPIYVGELNDKTFWRGFFLATLAVLPVSCFYWFTTKIFLKELGDVSDDWESVFYFLKIDKKLPP